MTFKTIIKKVEVSQSDYYCDLCSKPITVSAWILDRDPKKQKHHYHIDCLLELADRYLDVERRDDETN